MITDEKIVYQVWCNTDLTEGRGRQYVKCVSELESTAKRLAKHGYIMGSDCPIEQSKAYKIGGVWFYPSSPVTPSQADLDQEKELKVKREQNLRVLEAIKKAEELGLSKDDIEILQEGLKA